MFLRRNHAFKCLLLQSTPSHFGMQLVLAGHNLIRRLQVFSKFDSFDSKVAVLKIMDKSSLPILWVDDHKETQQLLQIWFELMGYQLTTVGTAAEGLQQAEECHYALFLLDLRLPDMDGMELCRNLHRLYADIPIILYSADARPERRPEAAQSGADSFMVKPCQLDDLTNEVDRLVHDGEII